MTASTRRDTGKLIVISLGATICNRDGNFDLSAIESISSQLRELSGADAYNILAVAGVGGACKNILEAYCKFSGADPDELKINISQMNAMLLICGLRKSGALVFPEPLKSLDEIKARLVQSGNEKEVGEKERGIILVSGGLAPGMTSDSSAAKASVELGADALLILSTVGGIYESDPEKNSKARRLERIDRTFLRGMLVSPPEGRHVLDPQTCRVLLDEEMRANKKEFPKCGVSGYSSIKSFVQNAFSKEDQKRNERDYTAMDLS